MMMRASSEVLMALFFELAGAGVLGFSVAGFWYELGNRFWVWIGGGAVVFLILWGIVIVREIRRMDWQ